MCGRVCSEIGRPVAPVCQYWLSEEYDWVKMSGKSKVVTWNVCRRAFNPSLDADGPYNVALVELDEDPRLFTQVVGGPLDEIRAGMRVETTYEPVKRR